jgi:very-short-patch-repair endonuclease
MIERNMFYRASRNTFEKAHGLRNNMTEAEKILWNELKNRKVFKTRFRRQHPIDIFVADLYCHEYKLVIEIDGEIHSIHEIQEHDDGRTYEIEKFGIKTLRFTNNQIFTDLDSVKENILKEVSKPPLGGRG